MSNPNDNIPAEQVYGVCLVPQKDNTPSITIYRADYISNDKAKFEKVKLDASTYFFGITDSLCFEIEHYYKQDAKGDKVLEWVIEKSAPECLSKKIEDMFREKGGFDKWKIWLNAYGLIDEMNLRESSTLADCSIVEIDGHLLYFSSNARSPLSKENAEPELLFLEAYVIEFRHKMLWHILKMVGGKYSHKKQQSLEETSLSKIGTSHNNCQIYLISRKGVIENCAKYATGLIGSIVDAMRDIEINLICDRARKRISNNLHRFTYGGDIFQERKFDELCSFKWFKYILGGFDLQTRNEFYIKAGTHASDESVRSICSFLSSLTGELEELASDSFISAVIVNRTPTNITEQNLFLFEFLGRDYLVGVTPNSLPLAANGDIPVLDVRNIKPVLLKTNLGNGKHLGMYYKRIATVRAKIMSYDDLNLEIAEFIEDVGDKHLIEFENGFLKSLLKTRTPFHERRLLQLLGIPCRQALGDVFYNRMLNGLRPIKPKSERYSYALRDDAMLEAIKQHLSLIGLLETTSSLDEFEQVLPGINVSLLGRMIILRKLSSFHAPLSQKIVESLKQASEELDNNGHYLAARLCRTVIGYSGVVPDMTTSKIAVDEWVFAFWKEISDCFPDSGSDWQRFRESAYEKSSRQNTEPKGKSAYTLFVLASVFDRQVTTFYSPLGRYTMPHDAMLWAINAVHRLQMLSCVLPLCCGDWACYPRADNPLSRRLLWNYQIASSLRSGGLKKEDTAGVQPQPSTDRDMYCYNNKCRHSPKTATLPSLAQALNFDNTIVAKVIQKMGWWFNCILDEEIHRRFRCKCGTMMAPVLSGKSLNYFSCPETRGEHDKNVYLSWCIHPNCSHVIDSREDKGKCDKNYIVCPECGCCCLDHLGKETYSNEIAISEIWIPACSKCTRALRDAWESIRDETIPDDGKEFVCVCGEANRVYPSREALWKATPEEKKSNVAIQWNMMDKFFSYNKRPIKTIVNPY